MTYGAIEGVLVEKIERWVGKQERSYYLGVTCQRHGIPSG